MDISLTRTFDAEFINSVLNHPSVRGGAKIAEGADLTETVNDYRNIVLVYEFGGFVVLWKGIGVYEVHTLALKEGRGKMLRSAIDLAMGYMFFQTDCERLITSAFKDNKASTALSDAYFHRKGENKTAYYYELSYRDWIERCEQAKSKGDAFHGLVETNHEDDDTHDYHVGGALLILENGNIAKAAKVYNEWAVMSGYEEIIILGINPLIARIGAMELICESQTVRVIKCQ